MKKFAALCLAALVAITTGLASTPNAAAANAAGAVRLDIPQDAWCRVGHNVMQGMATDLGTNLYVVFTQAGGMDPILTWWTRSAAPYWTCQKVMSSVNGINLGHANDITFQSDYLGSPALLIARGTGGSPSKNIAVVSLAASGEPISQGADLILATAVSGLCYSGTANGGAGYYAGHLTTSVYRFTKVSGKPSSSYTTRSLSVLAANADQGTDCSANNIWIARSIEAGGSSTVDNHVYQIGWTGGLIADIKVEGYGTLKASNWVTEEVEDVTHIGSDFFVGINRNTGDSPTPISDRIRDFSE